MQISFRKFLENFAVISLLLFHLEVFEANANLTNSEFKYRTNEELQETLENLALKHPDKAFLYSIGESVEGVELWVLSVSSHSPDKHVFLRPEIKYVGNMHGDETVGRELILLFAEFLLDRYDKDPSVERLLNSARVHLLPSMNPDGFANSQEGMCHTISASSRGNSNGEDLNRNFPDLWTENTAKIQPETQAVMDWLDRIPFVLSANIHGGALVINYPYDSNAESEVRYTVSPDDDVFRHLAATYANHHPTIQDGCSEEYFAGGVTNGAAWYTLTGGMQDYNYGFHGVLEITFELSCCKFPAADELSGFWQRNRIPMLKYLLEINRGIRGVILDKNQNPVVANLQIQGRNSSFKSTDTGEFWRILLPGSYTLNVQADGYINTSVPFHISESQPILTKNVTIKSHAIEPELPNIKGPPPAEKFTTQSSVSTLKPSTEAVQIRTMQNYTSPQPDAGVQNSSNPKSGGASNFPELSLSLCLMGFFALCNVRF